MIHVQIFIVILSAFASLESFAAKKTLLILGDSLTEGYGVAQEKAFPHLLNLRLSKINSPWQVKASGISGSTTASALSRVKWIFRGQNPPESILLLLGSNDGLRALPVKDSKQNLLKAIQFIKTKKVEIYLGELYLPPNYGSKYTADFQAMYKEIAQTEKIALVPFILKNVGGRPEFNQGDGIHPNEKGHAKIAETLFDYFAPHLKPRRNL